MRVTSIAVALIAIFSTGAFAQSFIEPGKYSNNKSFTVEHLDSQTDFQILANGGSGLILKDRRIGNEYMISTNSSAEQILDTTSLNKILANAKKAGASALIEKVSLRNTSQSDNVLTSKLNVTFRIKSIFGEVRLAATSDVLVKKSTCSVSMWSSNSLGEKRSTCYNVTYYRGLKLVNFQSSLGNTLDRSIGLAVDVVLQLVGMAIERNETIYRIG